MARHARRRGLDDRPAGLGDAVPPVLRGRIVRGGGAMNRGILLKAARELWPITLLLGIAHCIAQGILSFVLPTFARELTNQVVRIPFLQNIIRGLIGTDFYGAYGPEL